MSGKQIQVGDLVMVVRNKSCCGIGDDIGHVFRVTGYFHGTRCAVCGDVRREPSVTIETQHGDWRGKPISRLKRIDPDNLQDDVPTKEGLHA